MRPTYAASRTTASITNSASCQLEVTTVAGYVSQLAYRGKKYATIRRHVAAIAKLHQLAGQPSPTSHEALRVVLDEVARVHGKRQRQAPAFSVAELK